MDAWTRGKHRRGRIGVFKVPESTRVLTVLIFDPGHQNGALMF